MDNDKIEITPEIKKCCDLMALIYKDTLKAENKSATGNLIKNSKCYATVNGKYVEIWFNLEDYWKYVENGRAKGKKMPPISAIEEWIKIKHIVPRAGKGGKVPTTKLLAFLIARGISKNGILPTKALLRSIDASLDVLDRIILEISGQLEITAYNELSEVVELK